MLKKLTNGVQVYMVTGYTDLRRSIDGLAMIVQAHITFEMPDERFCTQINFQNLDRHGIIEL